MPSRGGEGARSAAELRASAPAVSRHDLAAIRRRSLRVSDSARARCGLALARASERPQPLVMLKQIPLCFLWLRRATPGDRRGGSGVTAGGSRVLIRFSSLARPEIVVDARYRHFPPADVRRAG